MMHNTQGKPPTKRSENFSMDLNCMDKLYHFLEELGSGGFGKVKLAIHMLTGEKVAIKIIDKRTIGVRELPRVAAELSALKQLAHQNICRMFQFMETEEKFYIVMEYCNGGEMFDYIVKKERLAESEARHFFRQLVQAVAYIHSMGFAHRDLKPENLLLTQDLQLKVIDFGLCAKPLNGLSGTLRTCCGSPAYAAPELIQDNCYFGNEADIWSMGVLLYALLCGNLPFDDDNYAMLYKKIMRGTYIEPEFLSSQSKEFLRTMLTVNPRQRATITEILAHPWLNKNYEQQIKWRSIYNRNIIDEDVCRELVAYYGSNLDEMMLQIKQWRYDYLNSTYLILLQKKERKQNFVLPSYRGANNKLPCSPTIHASLDNDLELSGIEDSSNDSIHNDHDMTPAGKQEKETMALCSPSVFCHSPHHIGKRINVNSESPSPSPMELDKPEKGIAIYVNNKENQRPLPTTTAIRNRCPVGPSIHGRTGEETPRPKSVYTTPRRAAPIGGVYSPSVYRRPNSVERSSRIPATPANKQQQQQHFQQRSNSSDRPTSSHNSSPLATPPSSSNERLARFDTRDEIKSPSRLRQRVFSSLERKADKMINLLTPKKIRSDAPTKLKCIKTMVNVSVTSSLDPAKVREELIKVLKNQGMVPQQNGWKVSGSKRSASGSGQTTVELEVVAIENLQYVGVKRKRIQGDAFTYKKICEEVLRMAGL